MAQPFTLLQLTAVTETSTFILENCSRLKSVQGEALGGAAGLGRLLRQAVDTDIAGKVCMFQPLLS